MVVRVLRTAAPRATLPFVGSMLMMFLVVNVLCNWQRHTWHPACELEYSPRCGAVIHGRVPGRRTPPHACRPPHYYGGQCVCCGAGTSAQGCTVSDLEASAHDRDLGGVRRKRGGGLLHRGFGRFDREPHDCCADCLGPVPNPTSCARGRPRTTATLARRLVLLPGNTCAAVAGRFVPGAAVGLARVLSRKAVALAAQACGRSRRGTARASRVRPRAHAHTDDSRRRARDGPALPQHIASTPRLPVASRPLAVYCALLLWSAQTYGVNSAYLAPYGFARFSA